MTPRGDPERIYQAQREVTALPRSCLREPVPQIAEAARYLDAAVSAHLVGRARLADELIRLADMPAIRDWTESIWAAGSPYVVHRVIANSPPKIPRDGRTAERMPDETAKHNLLIRDGYHCRFCGIPVIRAEVRTRIRKAYPEALPWGRMNIEQHAAFQAMWVQYDHLQPHDRGGTNDLANMVITCGPCNYGRMNNTLDEVGLIDPRTRETIRSAWDGLERFVVA